MNRAHSLPACGALLALACATAASAAGLDRDTLLTDAPATPERGTVRVSAGASGQTQRASENSGITGSVLWVPFDRVAGDVGLYLQGADAGATPDGKGTINGPSARLRVQVLKQADVGFDLAVGARFKTVGFTNRRDGEVEFFSAIGRRFGRIEAILNTVFGAETQGPGRDLEAKGFVGYALSERLRAGIDSRVQAEFRDERGTKNPALEDYDVTAGPAVSWLPLKDVQVQALLGAAKPRGVRTASPAGRLLASIDF